MNSKSKPVKSKSKSSSAPRMIIKSATKSETKTTKTTSVPSKPGKQVPAAPLQTLNTVLKRDTTCNTYRVMLKMLNQMFRNMQSFMVSPLGVEVLTLSLMSGSGGKTFDELARLLIGHDIPPEELNDTIRYYKAVVTKIPSMDSVDIVFVNYLYCDNKYEMTQKFKDYVAVCLDLKAKSVDFSGDVTEIFGQIDAEIKEMTKRKFECTINLYPTVGRLMAVNCTFFSALPKYVPHVKYIGNFYSPEEDPLPMEFTIQNGVYKYYPHDLFEWIEMPYKNDMLSLCLILPKKPSELRSILERLSQADIFDIIFNSSEISANLHLPPVRLIWNFDMACQMQLAGIQKVFERDAEMSRMAKNHKNLHCESVIMNLDFSFMDLSKVNIPVQAGDLSKSQTKEQSSDSCPTFVLNNPFIYFLTYGKTPSRLVFFAGVVNRVEI